MKEIIVLLNRMGHNITTREYIRSSGQVLLYITSIDGVRYSTARQPEAHRKIKELAGSKWFFQSEEHRKVRELAGGKTDGK